MTFSEQYPQLVLWLTYHGTLCLRIGPAKTFEARVGDVGGFPPDAVGCGATPDEALAAAEIIAARWRVQTKLLQENLVAEPVEGMRDDPELSVTGWPNVPNPAFDPAAPPDDPVLRQTEFLED